MIEQSERTENRAESPRRAAHPGAAAESGVRARAILIGILLVIVTAKLVTQAELVVSSIVHIGYLQLPPVALGLILITFAVSRGMRMLSRKLELSRSDILVIYCMILVAAMVSSHGVVQKWLPPLAALNYFATTANRWADYFNPHINHLLMPWPTNRALESPVARDFYEGLRPGMPLPWMAWVTPLLMWGALILLVLFSFLCLASILRRQWVDNEKLSFPLAQLPLELADTAREGGIYRQRSLWFGIAIPVIVFGIKAIHQIIPAMPDITIQFLINSLPAFSDSPWNGVGYTPMTLSFAAVGFFYLLPTDVLFSIWFFFLLTRGEEAILTAYNLPTPPMPTYPPHLFTGYQSIGAYFVLVCYLLWVARPHLRMVWRVAIGRDRVDDTNEVLPYRFAVWGLVLSFLAAVVWLWVMGMSLWLAVLELGVFIFVIAIVLARSTAEAGMMMTETTFSPIDVYRMFGSIHALGPVNITMVTLLDNLLLRDQRGLLLTGMLDCMRIADGTKIRRRAFAGVLSFSVVLSMVVAVIVVLTTAYAHGASRFDSWMGTWSPQISYISYSSYFGSTSTTDPASRWQMPTFFFVGMAVTLFLTVMRTAFHWWPLHPLGYALAGSWTTVVFWFPCMLAWACKAATMRYGGMGSYIKARPFFLGLIIGEFGSAVVFSALNMFFGVPAPPFPWS